MRVSRLIQGKSRRMKPLVDRHDAERLTRSLKQLKALTTVKRRRLRHSS